MNKLLFPLISLILFFNNSFSQENKWDAMHGDINITALTTDSLFIWAALAPSSLSTIRMPELLKINKQTGERLFYTVLNSSIPNNRIQCLKADKYGNLWAGIYGKGIYKFDGSNWALYDSSNTPLKSPYINKIIEDDNGTLWFATAKGILSYNGTVWTLYEENYTFFNIENFKGVIAALSPFGLFKYNGLTWSQFDFANIGIDSHNILSLGMDSSGNEWYSTRNYGILKNEHGNWTNYNSTNTGIPIDFEDIRALTIDKENHIYFTILNKGIAIYDGNSWSFKNNFGKINDMMFELILTESDNSKLISTDWSGILRINDNQIKFYQVSNCPLSGGGINQILILKNNIKYFCAQRGVAKLNNNIWSFYNRDNCPLPGDQTICCAVSNYGEEWFGTLYGLAKFSNNKWSIYNDTNSVIPHPTISALAIDSTGTVWIGTRTGCVSYYYDVWHTYDNLPFDLISNIYVDKNNTKWISTNSNGLYVYDNVSWRQYNTNNSSIPSDIVNCVTTDSKNNYWIATANGVVKIDSGNNWTIYNKSNSGISDDFTTSIVVDKDDAVWIGTLIKGVNRFYDNQWTTYNMQNSLMHDDHVVSLSKDIYNNIYITGCANMVDIFNEQGIQSVEKSKSFSESYLLRQNYPNPFNPNTTINYTIPKQGNVIIKIYDVLGKEVQTLVNETKQAGSYSVNFNASKLSSGVYIYRIVAGDYTVAKKMTLLK